MSGKTCFATIFVAVLCLLTSGCFNIEHEIFLEPDGSGDMVMYISMPDIPAAMSEALMKDASNPQQDLQKLFDEVKQKFANELPPAIKLKEAKEVRRHGAFAYYIVLRFNQLNDVNSMIDKFAKESLSKAGIAPSTASKIESYWKIQLENDGDLTTITQSLYWDLEGMGAAMEMGKRESAKPPSDSSEPGKLQDSVKPKSGSKPARKAPTRRTAPIVGVVAPKEEPTIDDKMKEFFSEGMISMLVSSILKMRFVLHTPKKITETNADIVLNGNIAIWNASLGAFIKEKKPIEMKVTY